MKKRKFLSILAALLLIAVPAMAVFTGMDLDTTLSNLRRDIVEPTYGHYIRFDDFGDSSVNVAVRMYI